MTGEELAARFASAKPTRDGWSIKCPVHDDRVASVSLSVGADGRLLLYCHAGCRTPDLLAAVGLTVADLFDEAPLAAPRPLHNANQPWRLKGQGAQDGAAGSHPALSAASKPETYDYRDLEGTLLHQVVRGVGKTFRQRQPDGDGWRWKADGRRVPYRWPELVGAKTVWIVEGEKDADACWSHGVPATCNRGGAGKWGEAETAALVEVGVGRKSSRPSRHSPGCARAAIGLSIPTWGLRSKPARSTGTGVMSCTAS